MCRLAVAKDDRFAVSRLELDPEARRTRSRRSERSMPAPRVTS